MNYHSDPDSNADAEDVFSPIFPQYLSIRSGKEEPKQSQFKYLFRALLQIYIGSFSSKTDCLYITLNRRDSAVQNVQLIVYQLNYEDFSFSAENISPFSFVESNNPQRRIFLWYNRRHSEYSTIDKGKINCPITLPLLDYFYGISQGIISTDIDAQLSHGVESLKAELTKAVRERNKEKVMNSTSAKLDFLILKNTEDTRHIVEIHDDSFEIDK